MYIKSQVILYKNLKLKNYSDKMLQLICHSMQVQPTLPELCSYGIFLNVLNMARFWLSI